MGKHLSNPRGPPIPGPRAKGKLPTPVNCLSGKFPGVSRGGMVTPGIDSCITSTLSAVPVLFLDDWPVR